MKNGHWVIEPKGLKKRCKDITALTGFNLQAPPHSIFIAADFARQFIQVSLPFAVFAHGGNLLPLRTRGLS